MKKISFFNLGELDFRIKSITFRKARVGNYRSCGPRIFNELVYKLNGSSKQIFHDRTLDLVPDSVYFIPKKSENRQVIIEAGEIIHIEFISLTDDDLSSYPPEILNFSVGNQYKKLFVSAEEIWQRKNSGYYLRSHALISEILAGIVAERDNHYIQSGKYAIIAPALDHICENFRSEISIAGLAKLCGISDEYLRFLFKSLTGQTPLSYINNLRLESAREMLRSEFVSVAEAAEANGFENSGYFSRLFKKHYNIPPSRARFAEALLPTLYKEEQND